MSESAEGGTRSPDQQASPGDRLAADMWFLPRRLAVAGLAAGYFAAAAVLGGDAQVRHGGARLDTLRVHDPTLQVGVAAADDILARLFRIPVTGIVRTLQILVVLLPFAVAIPAFFMARALRAGSAAALGDLTRADLHAGISPPPDSGPEPEVGPVRDQVIDLWRNPDDTWRWRWRGPEATLTSNEAYLSRDEAVAAARVAYPGVPVQQDKPPKGAVLPAPRHKPGLRTRLAAAAVWLTLFLLGRRRAS